jgi:hypothetical protein
MGKGRLLAVAGGAGEWRARHDAASHVSWCGSSGWVSAAVFQIRGPRNRDSGRYGRQGLGSARSESVSWRLFDKILAYVETIVLIVASSSVGGARGYKRPKDPEAGDSWRGPSWGRGASGRHADADAGWAKLQQYQSSITTRAIGFGRWWRASWRLTLSRFTTATRRTERLRSAQHRRVLAGRAGRLVAVPACTISVVRVRRGLL